MEKIGEASIVAIQKQDIGFFSMPDLAGQKFPQAFQRKLSQYSPQALEKALDGEFFFDDKGLAKGSNSLIAILLNQKGIIPKDEHLLSIAEFGYAFNEDPEAFKSTYQDPAIISRTNGDKVPKNDYIAKKLFREIKRRGFTPTPEKPIIVSLTDLKLR